MKKLVLASIAVVVMGATASQADNLIREGSASTVQAPASTFDWTGGYIGVFAGVSHATSRVTDINGVEFFHRTGGTYSRSGTGGIIGGTLGYNWQHGSLVFGPEIETGYIFNDHFFPIYEGQQENPAILTEYGFHGVAAARLGYAANRTLFYSKFGLAAAHIKSAGGEFHGIGHTKDAQWGFDDYQAAYGEKTRIGFAVGAGIEWAVTDHWSLKGEYQYMNFGSATYRSMNSDGGRWGLFKFRDDLHTFKVGINHRF